jgi:hypothetical protein
MNTHFKPGTISIVSLHISMQLMCFDPSIALTWRSKQRHSSIEGKRTHSANGITAVASLRVTLRDPRWTASPVLLIHPSWTRYTKFKQSSISIKKIRSLSPRENYTDRTTADCQRC